MSKNAPAPDYKSSKDADSDTSGKVDSRETKYKHTTGGISPRVLDAP